MSFISDYKGAPISLFTPQGLTSTYSGTATPPASGTSNDASLASLCGAQWRTADGRTVTLVQNGGTALAAGLLVQSPASIGANHTDLAIPTGYSTVVGDTSLTVTLGGTLVTANQYAGGYAVISADTAAHGMGQMVKIASHPAQATTSGNVTLTLEDPLTVATLAGTTTVSLVLPQYGSLNGTDVTTSGVIVNPITQTGRVIGATLYPIPASTATVPSYGFIVVNGAAAVVHDSTTTAIGLDLMPSASTAGNVCTYVVATKSRIGTSTVAGQASKAQLITLQL